MKLLYLIFTSALIFIISSCSKSTKGCTDKNAENFSTQAEETNNTCVYPKEKFIGIWNLYGIRYDINADTMLIDSNFNFLTIKDTSLVTNLNLKFLLDSRTDSLPYQKTLYATSHPISVLRDVISIPGVWNQDSSFVYKGDIRYINNNEIRVVMQRKKILLDTTVYYSFDLIGHKQK